MPKSQESATSAQVQKKFGRYHDQAMREAVHVSKHGRPSIVMVPADEYERLKRRDREAMFVHELSPRDIAEIAVSEIPTASRYRTEDA